MRYMDVTQKIIGASFAVLGQLGFGFLEKVYENALAIEIRKTGLSVKQQFPIPVFYDDVQVGEYFADLLVHEKLVCEIKAVDRLAKEHETQLVNYLKATGSEIGLLINFGQSVSVKRKFLKYRNPVNPVHCSFSCKPS